MKKPHVEVVLRRNLGPCSDEDVAGFKDRRWLGTENIELEVRPRAVPLSADD